MNEDTIAQLGRKKDQYREDFRIVKNQIDELERRLQHIKGKLMYTDELIAEFKAEAVRSAAPPNVGALNALGRYVGVGLADASREYLKRNADRWHSTAIICNELLSDGLETSAQNLKGSIFITLKRLVDSGEVIETIHEGMRVFRWNMSKEKEKADQALRKVG